MQRQMLKSKIHRATVTDCDVDYVGSITVDTELMASADLLTNEQVHVWDIDNGARFVTYVIDGEPGSGTIQVNGAAAHLTRPGHKVIVASFGAYEESRPRDLLAGRRPRRRRQPRGRRRQQPGGAARHEGVQGRSRQGRPPDRTPVTLPRLAEMKAAGEPIVMVTAYDYPSARVAEEAGVDIVLVGDTAAMVVLGYPGTEPVSMDEMVMLGKAVRRGLQHAADGRRHADGQLRGQQRARGPERPAPGQGDRLPGDQARGGGDLGRAGAGDHPRRHPGDGPRRPDAADRHRARRLQDPGQGPRRARSSSARTPSPCSRSAASRSSSRRSRRRSPRRSSSASRCR